MKVHLYLKKVTRKYQYIWGSVSHCPISNRLHMCTLKGIITLLLLSSTAFAQNVKSWDSEDQSKIKREYKDSLVLQQRIQLDQHGIYLPRMLDVDSKGNIALFAFKQYKLVIIDGDTYQVNKYGSKGRGPREFKGAFDLSFHDGGNIIISDKKQYRISLWSREGEHLHNFKMNKEIMPTRVAFCEDGSIFVMNRFYRDHGMLSKLNYEGKVVNTFQELTSDISKNAFVYDGSLDCHNNNLFYAGYYKNFIRRYNENGELLYSRSIVDFEPNDQIVVEKKYGNQIRTSYASGLRKASGNIDANDSTLMVGFSNDEISATGDPMLLHKIDTYNYENGEYLYTYPLRSPALEFSILNGKVYTLESDEDGLYSIGIYKIPES